MDTAKEDLGKTSPLQQAQKHHFDDIVKIIEEHQQNDQQEQRHNQVVRPNYGPIMPGKHKQPASETITTTDDPSYEPTIKKARPSNSDFENKVIMTLLPKYLV